MSLGRQERFTAGQEVPERPPLGGVRTYKGEMGAPDPQPMPPAPPGVELRCAICLNQREQRVPATTIVRGYAVCDEHVELAGAPGFDIQKVRKGRQAT